MPRPLMPTIQKIIDLHGGLDALKAKSIAIENQPYMKLCIEVVGTRHNHSVISVAHYGRQNGDAMRDPDMEFEICPNGQWHPLSFRNDYMGLMQEVFFERDGKEFYRPRLKTDLNKFARQWSRNLAEQGFVDAYKRAASLASVTFRKPVNIPE